MSRSRPLFAIGALLLVGAGVFLTGLNWGLPRPRSVMDPYLFARHTTWSGDEVLRLAGPTEDANRGADVASHPPADRRRPVVVNATNEQRARIVRRYRLMSYQPDEWNTLKSLSEMRPGQGKLDPKLYQYGGLWVYPVGVLLKTASVLHLIDLHGEIGWYLDHPEAFGRFYVVSRLWSAFWGMIGIVAVYAVVRRIVGGWAFPALAAGCFIFMPVVIDMAHEAKPHLAGAVLMLLAALAASIYVERGARSVGCLAGALCGAALGMVLSALPIFLILPGMALLRPGSWRERFKIVVAAVGVGLAVYCLTNPYVPLNFLRNRAVLESNLGNSREMYHAQFTSKGIQNALYLIAAGTSPLLAIAGACGAVGLGIRAIRMRKNQTPAEVRRRATGLLLTLPALAVLGQCIAFATGKPGEFGRFMLMVDLFLLVEGVVAVQTFLSHRIPQLAAALILLVGAAIPGFYYLCGFVRDSRPTTSRLVEAERLRSLTDAGIRTLAVEADPAPYCLPPVDLFDRRIVLLPQGARAEEVGERPMVWVRTAERPLRVSRWLALFTTTPISWADKRFEDGVAPAR